MKTKKTLSEIITNTMFHKGIVMLVLFCFPLLSFGQWETELKRYSFEGNAIVEYELTSFKCRNLKGKNYIMWTVLETSNECLYQLERSTDNITYNTIYTLRGAKSPNYIELLNSFIDEKPLEGTSYYRVRRLIKGKETTRNIYVMNVTTGDYTLYANAK